MIIFHHLQTSRIANDFWHHTTHFVLPPHKNWPKRSSNCFRQMPNHNVTNSDRLSFLCHRFPQVIEAINSIYGHAGVYLKRISESETLTRVLLTCQMTPERDVVLEPGWGVDCRACLVWSTKTRSSR